MLRSFLALALCSAFVAASAAELGAPPGTPDNSYIPDTPEWKEVEAPPPPALRTQGLIPIDVSGTSLHFGVDPKSLTVGADGVVRYVVVATSPSGVVNGIYEGLKCDGGEVKVYARHNPDSGWVPTPDSQWRSMRDGSNAVRHTYAIARGGACRDASANGPASQIVQDLKAPADRRYWGGGVNR